MATRVRSKTAVIDFIVILSILFFSWPIIYATHNTVISESFDPSFRIIFNFILSYFFFYAYPIAILVLNHIERIDGSKRLLINILSAVVLTYIIWKSVFMAIEHTTTDLFVSIPIFVIVWSVTPILVLVFNNINNN